THAQYDEAVANYRQQALVAFREVEDGLSDTRLLKQQQEAQTTAADTARRAARLADSRYEHGDLNYLDVVDAERSQLTAERVSAQVKGARYGATIALIRALGGGWDAPKPETPKPAELPAPALAAPPSAPAAP